MTSGPIAVFDIDGTLTDTMDVDVECYERAIRELLETEVPSDWESLEEITDSAILAAACDWAGWPRPDSKTEASVAARVEELLRDALERTPHRFRPIEGARTVFSRLQARGWRVAMATGAWRPSALLKLGAASIPHDDVPLATSSEQYARRDIIRHAVGALDPSARDVVYVGDGVWDGRAAGSLGFGFVGVGVGKRANALGEVGAVGVVPDLADEARLVELLTRARPDR